MPSELRILVVGWSGHAVGRGVIAALGGVEGDLVEVPRHLHGLGEPAVHMRDLEGLDREGRACPTLVELIAEDERMFELERARGPKGRKP
jgi:hypothetical protein